MLDRELGQGACGEADDEARETCDRGPGDRAGDADERAYAAREGQNPHPTQREEGLVREQLEQSEPDGADHHLGHPPGCGVPTVVEQGEERGGEGHDAEAERDAEGQRSRPNPYQLRAEVPPIAAGKLGQDRQEHGAGELSERLPWEGRDTLGDLVDADETEGSQLTGDQGSDDQRVELSPEIGDDRADGQPGTVAPDLPRGACIPVQAIPRAGERVRREAEEYVGDEDPDDDGRGRRPQDCEGDHRSAHRELVADEDQRPGTLAERPVQRHVLGRGEPNRECRQADDRHDHEDLRLSVEGRHRVGEGSRRQQDDDAAAGLDRPSGVDERLVHPRATDERVADPDLAEHLHGAEDDRRDRDDAEGRG